MKIKNNFLFKSFLISIVIFIPLFIIAFLNQTNNTNIGNLSRNEVIYSVADKPALKMKVKVIFDGKNRIFSAVIDIDSQFVLNETEEEHYILLLGTIEFPLISMYNENMRVSYKRVNNFAPSLQRKMMDEYYSPLLHDIVTFYATTKPVVNDWKCKRLDGYFCYMNDRILRCYAESEH